MDHGFRRNGRKEHLYPPYLAVTDNFLLTFVLAQKQKSNSTSVNVGFRACETAHAIAGAEKMKTHGNMATPR